MSISEKLERRAELAPLPNPYRERPGYGQPDAVDPSGYSLSDRSGQPGDGSMVGLTGQHAVRPVAYSVDRGTRPRTDAEVYRAVYGRGMTGGREDPGGD